MPFFVVVQYQARPDQLDGLLALIRHDFSVSATAHPGRRFARVFQHDQEPWRLLGIEEWQQEEELRRHLEASAFAEALVAYGPPPLISALERLQHYRHMPHQPTALGCFTLTAPTEHAEEVERFICDEERRDALVAGGLALRAVYRLGGSPGRLLVLHGWQTHSDLDAYSATVERAIIRSLALNGTSIERFTGEIVAQYSWLNG